MATTTVSSYPARQGQSLLTNRTIIYLLALVGLAILAWWLKSAWPESMIFPEWLNFGLREPLDNVQTWVISQRNTHPLFLFFFDPISRFIDTMLRGLERILLALPWPVVLIAVFAIADKAAERRLAIFSVIGVLVMGLFGLWKESMQTLALMTVAVGISLAIGIPLGIASARRPGLEAVLRPVLDAMQTLPAFVYLIPVVLFFGIARVPSVIATVIYALPPAIRLTTLGIKQVAPSALEAADAFGSTARQKLFKVQLPLALPSILAGVNQTIMMALGIVVIAAMIGAGGLGKSVTDALRSQKAGAALEAGLAIVLMAIIFDRISTGAQGSKLGAAQASPYSGVPAWLRQYVYWAGYLMLMLFFVMLALGNPFLNEFPTGLRLSIRQPVDAAVAWMRDNLYEISLGSLTVGTKPFTDFTVRYILNGLRSFFTTLLPWPVVVLGFALLGQQAGGWRLALTAGIGTLCLGLLGMWQESMDTLSQVLVALLLTLLIGLPLGIQAARSATFEKVLRPFLDFLQTIPPFVYLVPVVMLFGVGRLPGVIASVLYALPPMIRLTTLGIQQVPLNTIEAARAFGSTPNQMLWKVQMPLALPSIMLGVNQAVMMVLSMVIIAALVGGGALGIKAVEGLARSQFGQGIEAGLAIVLLAVVLDRITQAWAKQK